MDDLKKMILDYVAQGVPRGGRRPRGQRRHAADHRRHRRFVLDGLAQAVPREEVRHPDSRRRRHPGGLRHGQQHRGAGEALPQEVDREEQSWRTATRSARSVPDRSDQPAGPGLFKEERFIHAPQGAEIEVEFPAGAAAEESHQHVRQQLPRAVQPSGRGRGRARGTRPSRLRHVLGPLHLRHAGHPPRAREQADGVPRHRRHPAVSLLHGRQRRRVRGRAYTSRT